MPTWSALTTLPGKAPAEALAEAMDAMDPAPEGVGVFEIEDGSGLWEVGAYFTAPPDGVALAILEAAFGARPFSVSELPEIDWVAKVRRDLSPITAGRFFLYGSHDADKAPEGVIALLIEAAMAFGTGHHGTTKGCLEALDRLATKGVRAQNVADIGCGTAVLAMAAARLWGRPVLASDIDAVAVDVAEANVTANGLDGQVRCLVATGFDHPVLEQAAPFDLVFANILMGPLIDLAPDMAAHVAPGGRAILSGLLTEQAERVIAAYDAAGFAVEDRAEIDVWATLTLRRQAGTT
jgi:ribosomal protein L11 methyltransferase